MATLVKEIYEAFISAGADEDKAKAAAEIIARSNEQFVTKDDNNLATKQDLERTELVLKNEIDIVKAQIKMLMWVIGGVGIPLVVGVIATFIGVFFTAP